MTEHECVFPEEQEPDGRLILAPCLECNTPAIEVVKEAQKLRLRLARMEEALKRCKDYASLNLQYEELAHSQNIVRVVDKALEGDCHE